MNMAVLSSSSRIRTAASLVLWDLRPLKVTGPGRTGGGMVEWPKPVVLRLAMSEAFLAMLRGS